MSDDRALFKKLNEAIAERAPALMRGRLMGAQPSIEETFFLGSILNQETEKLGLPENWYLHTALRFADEESAKTAPYKCSECGSRYGTSDKRNACSNSHLAAAANQKGE